MPYLDIYPQELTALQQELQKHPDLLVQLTSARTFEETLGTIAAYCDVALDGAYSHEDIVEIAGKLALKLKEKGAIHIQ
jgi:hypothetical protein